MPLYDFKCEHCGHRFEKIVSMFKLKDVVCPECGEKGAKKLFSLFSAPPPGCSTHSKYGFR